MTQPAADPHAPTTPAPDAGAIPPAASATPATTSAATPAATATEHAGADAADARAELAALDREYAAGEVAPRAYERQRARLLAALGGAGGAAPAAPQRPRYDPLKDPAGKA